MVWDLPKMTGGTPARRRSSPRSSTTGSCRASLPPAPARRTPSASATRAAVGNPPAAPTRTDRQPESDRFAELCAAGSDQRRSGLGLFRQPVRAVQHCRVRGPRRLVVEPEPRPRVGPELSARLLRQDHRSGAGAQFPPRRRSQHPVPHRGVQRLQRRRLQRPQHDAAGDQPAGADAEQPAVRLVRQPGVDAPHATERRLRCGDRRAGMRSMQAQLRFQF